jgi:hypothetical protein
MENAITIKKASTKSSVGQHGPPTNTKVGSGAAEEEAYKEYDFNTYQDMDAELLM